MELYGHLYPNTAQRRWHGAVTSLVNKFVEFLRAPAVGGSLTARANCAYGEFGVQEAIAAR